MLYVLYTLFFVSCVILICAVLLQPGKTDAGALFTSNVSSTAFGPRGTASVLSKITIIAASVFMLSALLISMPALSGNISVLSTTAETPAETPAEPQSVEPSTAPTTDANTQPVTTDGAVTIEPPSDTANTEPTNANAAPTNK